MHYYKRNIGDYAKKAARLSMLQHGAYTLLIDSCYDREEFPTLSMAIDWCWASSQEEIDAVTFVLTKFFTEQDGVFVQKRIKEEVDAYQQQALTNKRIAIEREAKRREEATNKSQSVTKRTPVVNDSPPNQEPLNTNHEPETSSGAKAKRFTPPTTTMVFEYMKERGVNDEFLSERFVDYYASKGWMIGKNKMKDWKAAVRTWLAKRKQEEPPQRPQMKESTPVKKPYISPEKRAKNIARFQEEKRKMGLL